MNLCKKSSKDCHLLLPLLFLWSPSAGFTSTAPPEPPSLSASPETIPQSLLYPPYSLTTLSSLASLSCYLIPEARPLWLISSFCWSVPSVLSSTASGSWLVQFLRPPSLLSLQHVPNSPLYASVSPGLSSLCGSSVFRN